MSKQVSINCPNCDACQDDIRYVQDMKEYHHIDSVYENGDVDLAALDESWPDDEYSFHCTKCEWMFSFEKAAITSKNDIQACPFCKCQRTAFSLKLWDAQERKLDTEYGNSVELVEHKCLNDECRRSFWA